MKKKIETDDNNTKIKKSTEVAEVESTKEKKAVAKKSTNRFTSTSCFEISFLSSFSQYVLLIAEYLPIILSVHSPKLKISKHFLIAVYSAFLKSNNVPSTSHKITFIIFLFIPLLTF